MGKFDRYYEVRDMILQPVIRISGADGQKIFMSVEQNMHMTRDEELLELEMLYGPAVIRHKVEQAA